MTVKELIGLLTKMPADALVVGRGYESGYDDVGVNVCVIYDRQGPGEKSSWWAGRYDDAEYEEHRGIEAVVIQ